MDGGVDSLTAATVIPVAWLVWATTVGKLIEFALPLYAKLLQRWSPDKALIAEDAAEAILGLGALGIIVFAPDLQIPVLLAYLFLLLFLYPISDIADEFYGAKLAEISENDALAFNASLYMWLGIVGFIFAVPAGALLAGLSIQVLIVANIVLTMVGICFRLYARSNSPMGPLIDADADDFAVVGSPQPLKQFLHDLFRSGPASPAVSFLLQIIGALSGHLILIWAATTSNIAPTSSMAIVLLVFGVGTAVGPVLSRIFAKRMPTPRLLKIAALLSSANILWFAILIVTVGTPSFPIILIFIFLNVLLNRFRLVVLETHRQTYFKGSQYARVMSWSYAFGAAGTLIGIQLAFALGAQKQPLNSLLVALTIWIVIALVVRSRLTPTLEISREAL